MDATPEAFAYRCLPLNIANAHGWEILNPIPFEACWNGGTGIGDVQLRLPADAPHDVRPVSLFGQAVLTFHIFGIFRTPPGWNLWVGGSPNSPKDGIYPLTGIVETDWAPYTFTMNWRFTRPGMVSFKKDEPFCFITPIPHEALDDIEPIVKSIHDDPELKRQYDAWGESRSNFLAKLADKEGEAVRHGWQRDYFRGRTPEGHVAPDSHINRRRLKPPRPAKPGE